MTEIRDPDLVKREDDAHDVYSDGMSDLGDDLRRTLCELQAEQRLRDKTYDVKIVDEQAGIAAGKEADMADNDKLTMSDALELYRSDWAELNRSDGTQNTQMRRFYRALWQAFRAEWYPKFYGCDAPVYVKQSNDLTECGRDADCAVAFDQWLWPDLDRHSWARELGTDADKDRDEEQRTTAANTDTNWSAYTTRYDRKLADLDRKLDAVLAALPVLASGVDAARGYDTERARLATTSVKLARAVNEALADRLDHPRPQ